MALEKSENQDLPEPAIGVGGILFNSHDQVLLIRRNQAPAKGLWSLPGGRQEPGESILQTCVREMQEETGMLVRVLNLTAVVDRQIEAYHYVIMDFLVEMLPQSPSIPVAQSDVSEAKWIAMSELQQYELVIGLEIILLRTFNMFKNCAAQGLLDAEGAGTDFILPY